MTLEEMMGEIQEGMRLLNKKSLQELGQTLAPRKPWNRFKSGELRETITDIIYNQYYTNKTHELVLAMNTINKLRAV